MSTIQVGTRLVREFGKGSNLKKVVTEVLDGKVYTKVLNKDGKVVQERVKAFAEKNVGDKFVKTTTKVLKEESKYIKALEDYFAIEDSIANALDTLTEEEREIIVEYYMQGYPERKIARIMNYSERSIRYIKAKAITKISKKL